MMAVLSVCLISSFLLLPAKSPAEEKTASCLILYHTDPSPKLSGIFNLSNDAILLTNLLGHFDLEIAQAPIENYYPGLIKNYRYVFYIGKKNGPRIPDSFLQDVIAHDRTTVTWLGAGVERLLALAPEHFGFKTLPPQEGFKWIGYNDKKYIRPDIEEVPVIVPMRWEELETKGQLTSDKGSIPFSVHDKNLWYFPDLDFYGISNLVFADLLHDILDQAHDHRQRFYVRLEDIHPLRDPGRLRDCCSVLHETRTPFMMGIIQEYRKPGKTEPILLKDKPHLLRAIKECTALGGSIVMHGVTHQYGNETGEGHEFWDVDHDRPIAEYTEEILTERMNRGIDALVGLGLYPIAWETPHYAASELAYRIIGNFFSTAVESLQVSDRTYRANQTLPYISRDIYGRTLIPENIGYLNLEEGETIEKKIAEAAKLLIVRDAVVGFFYHPYFEAKYLAEVVKKLQAMDLRSLDLRDIPSSVLGKNVAIFSDVTANQMIQGNDKFRPLDKDASLVLVKGDDDWLRTYYVGSGSEPYGERWSRERLRGETAVELPKRPRSLFVIELLKKRDFAKERKHDLIQLILFGKTNSLAETIMRLSLWGFFFITAILLIIGIRILMERTSYHGSHRREE